MIDKYEYRKLTRLLNKEKYREYSSQTHITFTETALERIVNDWGILNPLSTVMEEESLIVVRETVFAMRHAGKDRILISLED